MLSAAFLEQDDDTSVRDLVKHATATDIVIPDWYYLTDGQCSITQKENPKITATISSSSRALIVPRYTNGLDNKWHGQETEAMLADPKTNTCVAQKLSDLIIKSGVAGINIDLENLRPEDKDNYLDFLNTLATNLHQQQKILTVDVSVGDPAYDLEYIGQIADYVIVMNYDEHYLTGTPGPIASANWFSDNIDTATAAIPKNKIIVALGAYGYDWTVGSNAPAIL